MADFDPSSEYPIGANRPDLIRTPSGHGLADLTMDRLRDGSIPEDDFRATSATLRLQAEVARHNHQRQLADNLERAAELANIPDEVILDVYTALRPRRSSAEDLENLASRLETTYEAPASAQLVREAATAYARQGILA